MSHRRVRQVAKGKKQHIGLYTHLPLQPGSILVWTAFGLLCTLMKHNSAMIVLDRFSKKAQFIPCIYQLCYFQRWYALQEKARMPY